MNNRYPALTVAFAMLIAVGFFFAGYSVRATVAAAQPAPTSTGKGDGNPVGHSLTPPGGEESAAAVSQVKSMQFVFRYPVAIRYVTAPVGGTIWFKPKPSCSDRGVVEPCFAFAWKNVWIRSRFKNGPNADPEHVDVYGTVSLKALPI